MTNNHNISHKVFCVVFSLASGLTSTLAFVPAAHAEDETCRKALIGIEKRYNGYDSWRTMNIEITDDQGNKKTRKIHAAHQNTGIERHLRSKALEPAELAGFEAMAYDYFLDGQSDKVWTYMSSQGKVQDMKSEDLSGRLYGSDMAIGEMLIRRSKDYDCSYLGDADYQGMSVWKVYVNPRTDAEVIRLGLRDGEVWVEKNTFLPVWSTFNADAPNEQRVFTTDKSRWIDGVFAPAYFKIQTRKEGRVISTSVFQVEGEHFNIGLPNEWFDVKDLGNAKSTWNTWDSSKAVF